MAVYDAWSIAFDGTVILCRDFAFSVNGGTQCVDYTAQIFFANRDTGSLFSTGYFHTLTDTGVFAKNDTSDLGAFYILYHAFYAIFKNNDLAVHSMFDAVDRSDAVTNPDNGTDFVFPAFYFIILNLAS